MRELVEGKFIPLQVLHGSDTPEARDMSGV